MTTSLLFTVLAAALHLVVLFEVTRFFRSQGHCREADKHLVAVAGVGSVCFVLVQTAQVIGHPIWYDDSNTYAGLWSGFAIFNAALYYGLAKMMADRRTSEAGMDATDIYHAREKLRKIRSEHHGHRHGEHT